MKHMILSAFFFNPQGDHRMSWRHPRAPSREVFGLDYYRDLAVSLEAACMDMLFVADHVGVWDSYESNMRHYANARLEPLTLLAALSAVTSHIGLVGTASTSYTEPYHLARSFASLDYLSGGRAGWNVVTSGMTEEALNFGRDATIDHAVRYERAGEFLDVTKDLWDSWHDDALRIDKRSGVFADPSLVRRIDHVGKHFKVRGPLNVPRPPQGYPLIVQAGSSESGRDLAARHADVNFSLSRSIDDGRSYRSDFNRRLAQFGRSPESLKILPGVLPIVGNSIAEAQEKREFMEMMVPEQLGVDLVSSWAGIDMSAHPLDGPLPRLPDEAGYDGQRTNLVRLKEYAAERLTIREVARRIANAGSAPMLVGKASDIADEMEAWFKAGAADGFNLMFPLLPEDAALFAQKVVPELQKRELTPAQYAPGSLRDRLGLVRPPNRARELS